MHFVAVTILKLYFQQDVFYVALTSKLQAHRTLGGIRTHVYGFKCKSYAEYILKGNRLVLLYFIQWYDPQRDKIEKLFCLDKPDFFKSTQNVEEAFLP